VRVYVAPGTYGVSPVGAFTIAIGACSAGDGARTPALQTAAAVPSCWVRTVWWHWIGSARTWLRRSLSATPGLPSTTAGSLARRFTDDSWAGIETATADLTDRAAGLLPVDRRVKLGARATVDPGFHRRGDLRQSQAGVAYNYAGQRAGRPRRATWAEAGVTVAAS